MQSRERQDMSGIFGRMDGVGEECMTEGDALQKTNFDRNTTAMIKGIALILMFIHHFFAYPEWYVEGIAYPQLAGHIRFFRYSMKICVPVFAFLTGYFYAFSQKKTLRYSLRKITDLLVSYWLCFVLILMIALLTGYRELSAFGFLMGILGRNTSLMTFCWYVSFYCLAMLMLPLLTGTDKRGPVRDLVLLIIMPIAASSILESLIESKTISTMIEEVGIWFPCVASGYLCAKYGVFGRADARIGCQRGNALLYGACICFAVAGRYFCDSFTLSICCLDKDWTMRCTMDVFYAPAFVYGAAMLLQRIKNKYVIGVFKRIGDHSQRMWFIHCVFFNVSNEVTQRILYWPKQPVLVVAFGLLICYAAAWAVSPLSLSIPTDC